MLVCEAGATLIDKITYFRLIIDNFFCYCVLISILQYEGSLNHLHKTNAKFYIISISVYINFDPFSTAEIMLPNLNAY